MWGDVGLLELQARSSVGNSAERLAKNFFWDFCEQVGTWDAASVDKE